MPGKILGMDTAITYPAPPHNHQIDRTARFRRSRIGTIAPINNTEACENRCLAKNVPYDL